MRTDNQLLQAAHEQAVNSERLKLYLQRREVYLRYLGEGCKVSFPFVPTSNEVRRYVV